MICGHCGCHVIAPAEHRCVDETGGKPALEAAGLGMIDLASGRVRMLPQFVRADGFVCSVCMNVAVPRAGDVCESCLLARERLPVPICEQCGVEVKVDKPVFCDSDRCPLRNRLPLHVHPPKSARPWLRVPFTTFWLRPLDIVVGLVVFPFWAFGVWNVLKLLFS